jgi:hypothetical protein
VARCLPRAGSKATGTWRRGEGPRRDARR